MKRVNKVPAAFNGLLRGMISQNQMSKISTKQIAEAIYSSAKNKGGAELDHVLKNAVDFLAKKNLLSKSPEILRHLEHISDAETNTLRAKVLSKNPLTKKMSDQVENFLKKRYETKTPALQWQEDKTLIGGMRIETEDEILDLSLKNKLNQLQDYLLTQ